jgi:uncharacterized protein with von Willebrand factor type A (vWA) domain
MLGALFDILKNDNIEFYLRFKDDTYRLTLKDSNKVFEGEDIQKILEEVVDHLDEMEG